MFVEIGTFSDPKVVLCIGMHPDPGGVFLHYMHSNRSRLELACERIDGLAHHQLSLALKEPPSDPVSPFLNLKRENIPAIIEWSNRLERRRWWSHLKLRADHPAGNILVDIGTFSQPRTVSPFVFQPDGDDVLISYLDETSSAPRAAHLTVQQARIAGLSYKQLLMTLKHPPADANSPFLNLKNENIPELVARLPKTQAEAAPERPKLRVVASGASQWFAGPPRPALRVVASGVKNWLSHPLRKQA